jgi:hypothetical protein
MIGTATSMVCYCAQLSDREMEARRDNLFLLLDARKDKNRSKITCCFLIGVVIYMVLRIKNGEVAKIISRLVPAEECSTVLDVVLPRESIRWGLSSRVPLLAQA